MINRKWWIVDYFNRYKTYTFGWCSDPNCRYPEEHNIRFDGQIFYKVKA